MAPADLADVASWVTEAGDGAVVALTGAGISTESGIPDFRGPQGLWTTDPPAAAMFHIDRYRSDAELRRKAWRNRREHAAWTARPNRGHEALAALERAGLLRAVLTQNIDGLQQQAGSAVDRVLELHGTIWWVRCLECGASTPTQEVFGRLDAGEDDPACLACGGIQRSATVAFGQSLDATVLLAAVEHSRQARVFLAVGTSLQVNPAASLCDVARQAGARLVVVNASPTPYDEVADAVLREPIGQVLPALVPTS